MQSPCLFGQKSFILSIECTFRPIHWSLLNCLPLPYSSRFEPSTAADLSHILTKQPVQSVRRNFPLKDRVYEIKISGRGSWYLPWWFWSILSSMNQVCWTAGSHTCRNVVLGVWWGYSRGCLLVTKSSCGLIQVIFF